MKLIRFGNFKKEKPGLLDNRGKRRDCSALVADFNADFFAGGGLEKLRLVDPESLPEVPADVRWGAPVARPGKVICIGLNYRDHAAESNMEVPDEPIVFFKAPNAVVGPYDEVLIPRGGEQTDWEVELCIIIGGEARYLESRTAALKCIAGYCVTNDISERHFQLYRGGQWVKGKSCDTFNPLGPWLASADEIADVNNLKMMLDVNGQRRQTGNTSTMIFPVDEIVRYLSHFMTLEVFLKPGDIMELSIEGLGKQRQTCGQA
jgi:2-keto-4-pentenoate hydratase/2-oxohepta-3-ene-1,7-dioic acid hydratase in catechol pathway